MDEHNWAKNKTVSDKYEQVRTSTASTRSKRTKANQV